MDAAKYREEIYTFRELGSGPVASSGGTVPQPVRRNVGRGRSVYIPAVRPAIRKPPGVSLTSQYWKLPLNWQQVVDDVKWAANGVSLQVKGPLTLVAEPQEQTSTGRVLVHLLNYDDARHPSVENVEVSVRVPEGKTVERVRLYSPDSATSPVLNHTVTGGAVTFTVPRIRTYSIAAVEVK